MGPWDIVSNIGRRSCDESPINLGLNPEFSTQFHPIFTFFQPDSQRLCATRRSFSRSSSGVQRVSVA